MFMRRDGSLFGVLPNANVFKESPHNARSALTVEFQPPAAC
jgi:hypothetical protein